jgi:three-Cys-motif partner protein
MTPERCGACGKQLDGGALTCRVCGEPQQQPDDAISEDLLEIDYALLDRLGEWSHVKHDILDKYARAYMTIMKAQRFIKRVVYIDGFAGLGIAEDRNSGELRLGSAMRAVDVEPPFHELHFVEEHEDKAALLRRNTAHDSRVRVYAGDANEVLLSKILPRCRFDDYARGLCLLDPYGLSVDWTLIHTIGQMKSVEVFFNFMVVGANRNVLWKNPERVPPARLPLMDRVWGDRSWVEVLYRRQEDLFGLRSPEKLPNEAVAMAYRERLRKVAGFAYVPEPIPMKNTKGMTIYYLFFASPNETGASIVRDIFDRYRRQ